MCRQHDEAFYTLIIIYKERLLAAHNDRTI